MDFFGRNFLNYIQFLIWDPHFSKVYYIQGTVRQTSVDLKIEICPKSKFFSSQLYLHVQCVVHDICVYSAVDVTWVKGLGRTLSNAYWLKRVAKHWILSFGFLRRFLTKVVKHNNESGMQPKIQLNLRPKFKFINVDQLSYVKRLTRYSNDIV